MSKMLSSWKEIAHFFGKGVRTVQRWEKTLDLPIHRPPGAPSNVVLARTTDLEEWMHRGPVARAVLDEASDAWADPLTAIALVRLEEEIHLLTLQSGIRIEATATDPTPRERIEMLSSTISRLRESDDSRQNVRAA